MLKRHDRRPLGELLIDRAEIVGDGLLEFEREAIGPDFAGMAGRVGAASIHDEQLGADRRERAVGRVAEIGDLVAHARRQRKTAAIP